jgi:hypothetical protein
MLVTAVAGGTHAVLLQRADMLEGCPEQESIVDAVEAYETDPWPTGKVDEARASSSASALTVSIGGQSDPQ